MPSINYYLTPVDRERPLFAAFTKRTSFKYYAVMKTLVRMNRNYFLKKQLADVLEVDPKRLKETLKELLELNVCQLHGEYVYLNPDLCWAGSYPSKEYRTKCYKENVPDLDVQKIIKQDEESFVDGLYYASKQTADSL